MNRVTWKHGADHRCPVNKVRCLRKPSTPFSSCPQDSPRFLPVTQLHIHFVLRGSKILKSGEAGLSFSSAPQPLMTPIHSPQPPNQFQKKSFQKDTLNNTLYTHPAHRNSYGQGVRAQEGPASPRWPLSLHAKVSGDH